MNIHVWAPGRVNLIGEHTDHTEGLVLPMAIDRGISFDVRSTSGPIRLESPEFGVVTTSPTGSDLQQLGGWGRYVAAVAAELHKYGREPIGVEGTITSALPHGIGLSSSAALEVGAALALCAAADLEMDRVELAQLCQRAEHAAVGVPCGVMDQAASLLGSEGSAVLLDCQSLDYELVPLPTDLTVLVIESGLVRQLESTPYSQRLAELHQAIPALGGRRPADVDPESLADLIRSTDTADAPARRLRHVVSENQRVRRAVQALRTQPVDLHGLAAAVNDSHRSLRDDFEVSLPDLDVLVDCALANGALAARLTGAGFGGAVIALTESHQATTVGRRVIEDYQRRTTHSAKLLACRPSEGATTTRT